MKITKWALSAAIAAACLGGSASAQQPSGATASDYYAQDPAPVVSSAQLQEYSAVIPASCGCTDTPVSGGCDTSCDLGCDGGCDSACGGGCGGLLAGLKDSGYDFGGWASVGYHTYNNSLFNSHADRVRLHQAWLYAEKAADGSDGLGFGGRIDYLYGVDAQDTQAFGIDNDHWDNSWDNGIYGHAIPQLYGEIAYGDLSVIVGHFFTLIGYEVVGAPGNFFYSHSYTMYNSEPFTHTGALATYSAGDNLTLYGGYVMGWDSGFEDNGDAFLGGYSVDLTDNLNITNQYVVGRFGETKGPVDDGFRNGGEVGWMTSFIATATLTDKLTYVFWTDILDTDHGNGNPTERETFDVNQYILYTLNDYLVWGSRLEWYNIDKGVYDVTDGRSDIYAFTTGFNVKPGENLIFRPEIRWDWDKDGVAGLELGNSQTTFGMDAIFTF
ncbi:MAG: porin [bacterium]|nr:porin [bacterium]